MNVNELRELTPAELDEKIYELKQNLFELRRKKAVGQLEHGEEMRNLRKTLAKAETVKRQRELGITK
ncbi:MAG: 50S ribosomal protein L29 [Bacilli bacterium]|nr:50S ribosomal protein L29 [Bacilli bacterium]MBO6284899.1 50S ribosomal protein L29 [Bacilli bacterium]